MSHCHLLIASSLQTAPLPEELKHESADTRHLLVNSLGIDEARLLVQQSSATSWSGKSYNFVIVTSGITLEAQNALLKLFEEPPAGTVFYLVIPSESLLLPTLRSRFVSAVTTKNETSQLADSFLSKSLREKLEFITEQAKQDPKKLEQLVTAIGNFRGELTPEAKRALLLVDKYVYNRGASRKMLLEELALSL